MDSASHSNGGGSHDNSGWVKAQSYDYETLANGGAYEGSARVYEWEGEYGDVGPRDEALELELFGDPSNPELPQGIDFSRVTEIRLVQEGPERIDPIKTFEDAGLHPALLANIKLCNLQIPTPIQKYCLPAISLGYDVIATAQTGSGKTIAYLVPVLNKLMGKFKKLAAPRPSAQEFRDNPSAFARAEPLVVVVVPTRELAIQIFNVARKLCYRSMLRPSIIYGGSSIGDQLALLARGCDVLIATPGRLLDFMDRPERLTLRRLRHMIIDEADEMLHDDWQTELPRILGGGEQEEGNLQYLLFSATFPKQVQELAKTHLAETHVRFRVGRAGSTTENIEQRVYALDHSAKRDKVIELLQASAVRTIIFVNSKRLCDELDDFIYNKGMPCTSMHSDRTQREREDAMRAFRSGKAPILITTGVSARGIDVRNVFHVINYDLPSIDYGGIEEYTHRIGRTGRIGHRGLASSFYTDRDEAIASVLVRTLLETKQEIPTFLHSYMPEGDNLINLKFEAEGDFDVGTDGPGIDGDVWGHDDGAGVGAAVHAEGGEWGGPAKAETSESGWGGQTIMATSTTSGGVGDGGGGGW